MTSTRSESSDRSRDDSPRVLHVLAPGSVGGLESVVLALAAGQTRAGHHVRVACILPAGTGKEHPFVLALEGAGVSAVQVPVGGRAYLAERAAIRDLCRSLRPTVVHTHGYRPDVVDSGIARAWNIPTVTTVHGFTGGGWRNRVYERLQLLAFRRMSAVVAVSRSLRDLLASRGVPSGRLHLIPNAYRERGAALGRVQARAALALPGDASGVLGFVGRLSAEKGADIFIEALARLGDEHWRAVIVGDGPARRGLEARARALGISQRVQWAGVVPDAASLFPAFDAFVLSSRTEGTPIALFEAMACSLPIVATAVGGVPDVVSSSEAVLVEADSEAVAHGIRDILSDPAAARARGARAKRRLDSEFAPVPWLERYDRLYRALAADRTRAA